MPVTLVSMPQSNLQGAFSSVPTPGAVQIPAGCTSITCTLTMPASDQTNTLNSVNWSIYVSPDGTTNWQRIYGPEYWQGGTTLNHQGVSIPNPVTFSYGMAPAYQGQFLKAEGTVNRRQQLGCTVVANP